MIDMKVSIMPIRYSHLSRLNSEHFVTNREEALDYRRDAAHKNESSFILCNLLSCFTEVLASCQGVPGMLHFRIDYNFFSRCSYISIEDGVRYLLEL